MIVAKEFIFRTLGELESSFDALAVKFRIRSLDKGGLPAGFSQFWI
jgi:hypothetical protein